MKKRAIMKALDQIRASIGDLKNLPGALFNLNLPAIFALYFNKALARPDVQAIDV